MSLFTNAIQRGNRASQPAANSVIVGTLYFVTDENITERSNGTIWQSYSGPASGGGSGTTVIQQILREETIFEEPIPIPGPAGAAGGGSSSVVKQIVFTESSAVATSSTVIPFDDTIPQNTEGAEIFTVTITPTNSSNKLKITVTIFASVTTTPWIIAALFQDSNANALAVAAGFPPVSTSGQTITFTHIMDAGTTSATTFKVRVGPSGAATVTVNGQSGGRIFGGAAASSIVVEEYTP